MNEYLKNTLENLNTKNYSVLNIVLGNESCDLDSVVSAVVYAAFLCWQHKQMKCKVCTRTKRTEAVKDEIFVPILNVDRRDYEIKTEVAFCLQQHGIHMDNLVFKDDQPWSTLLSSSNANVILVDHHVLAITDQHLTSYVKEIIDHRPIDKSQWRYKDDTRSTIEIVGSCATLVAQRIKDLSALFAKDVDFFMAHKDCCDMLHSTIILDTVNFSKEVNKGTPHDEEMVLFLETFLTLGDFEAQRKDKLEQLVSARTDVSRLTAAQLLRKDAKQVGDILVPTLPLLVKDFLLRPGALSAIDAALAAPGCSAALLLGVQLSGGGRRDMAVYCSERSVRDKLCSILLAWQPSLDLLDDASADRLRDQSADQSLRYFTQRNIAASRKQYIPALNEYMTLK